MNASHFNPYGQPGSSSSSGYPPHHLAHGHDLSHNDSAASSPASSAPASGAGPALPLSLSGPLVQPHQDLNEFLESFWTRQMDGVERENPDFKTYNLPLARIKKVMKSDEEVKMISAEAPVMFSKACEIFIAELTCRAWLVAESHKRRTLQKSDVAAAIAFSDMFDFLIDIVPRDDGDGGAGGGGGAAASGSAGAGAGGRYASDDDGAGEDGEDGLEGHVSGQQDLGEDVGEWLYAGEGADGEVGVMPPGIGVEGEEALYSDYVEGETYG